MLKDLSTYNHETPLEYYKNNIDILKRHGFNCIGVSQMYLEDTYIFETKEEATKAYRQFERDENENWIGKIAGWWYSKEDFDSTVIEYEKEMNTKVLIYWL